MMGYIEMQDPTTVIAENNEPKRILKLAVGIVKKSSEMSSLEWFSKNVRQHWDGGPPLRIMYFDMVASETSMPSFRSSP